MLARENACLYAHIRALAFSLGTSSSALTAGNSMPLPIWRPPTAERCVRRGDKAGALATAAWGRTEPAYAQNIEDREVSRLARQMQASTTRIPSIGQGEKDPPLTPRSESHERLADALDRVTVHISEPVRL